MNKKPWERQKGEPIKSYEHFQKYAEMGTSRSLKRLHKEYDDNTLKKDRIAQLSVKWDWVARADKYDEYLIKRRMLRHEKKLDEVEDVVIDTLLTRVKVYNDNMIKVVKDEKSYDTTKARALESNSKGYRNEIETGYMVGNRPTQHTENTNINFNKNEDVDKSDELSSLFEDKIKEVKSQKDVDSK